MAPQPARGRGVFTREASRRLPERRVTAKSSRLVSVVGANLQGPPGAGAWRRRRFADSPKTLDAGWARFGGQLLRFPTRNWTREVVR